MTWADNKLAKWEADREAEELVDQALFLAPIEPANLHAVWDMVYEDLDTCRAHDASTTWMEDIYTSIRNNWATLYVGRQGGEYAGCLLLQMKQDPWESIPIVHIWMCANHGDHNLLKEGQAQLDEIARGYGAKTITFRSDKLSFERLCRDLGYCLREIELVREVPDVY